MADSQQKYQIEADWVLNDFCNYSCDYCFFHSKKEHELVGLISPDQYLNFFNATGRTWLFHFTGGEPFFHPQFVELCSKLSTSHFIALNSNLSSENVYDFAHQIDTSRVEYIHCGLHAKQRERHEGVQPLLDKIAALLNKGFTVFASSVMAPDDFDGFERLRARFDIAGVPLIPKALRGMYNGKPYPESYTAHEREKFREFSSTASRAMQARWGNLLSAGLTINPLLDKNFLDGFPDFTGVACNAGKTFVRIKPDGTIYRCGMHTVLGNIFKQDLKLYESSRSCDDTCCPYICIKYTDLKAIELQRLPRRF